MNHRPLIATLLFCASAFACAWTAPRGCHAGDAPAWLLPFVAFQREQKGNPDALRLEATLPFGGGLGDQARCPAPAGAPVTSPKPTNLPFQRRTQRQFRFVMVALRAAAQQRRVLQVSFPAAENATLFFEPADIDWEPSVALDDANSVHITSVFPEARDVLYAKLDEARRAISVRPCKVLASHLLRRSRH